jgi:hypothetical protein
LDEQRTAPGLRDGLLEDGQAGLADVQEALARSA